MSLTRNPENTGFGAAINRALNELTAPSAPPEFILMMNPDVHVRSDAVARLRAALDADPSAAFSGPLIRLAGTGALR